jgi:hypothetical protein
MIVKRLHANCNVDEEDFTQLIFPEIHYILKCLFPYSSNVTGQSLISTLGYHLTFPYIIPY